MPPIMIEKHRIDVVEQAYDHWPTRYGAMGEDQLKERIQLIQDTPIREPEKTAAEL